MPDFAESLRRLTRRLVARPPEKGEVPGTTTEADGQAAAITIESWLQRPPLSPWERGLGGEGAPKAPPGSGLATALGLAAAGRRATAWLTPAELAASVTLLGEARRRHLPLVVHVSPRTHQDDSVPSGGFKGGEDSVHAALHAAAVQGAVVLCAADVQEVVDLTIFARRLAEDALVPVVVMMDGRETAFSIRDFLLPTPAAVHAYLGRPGELMHPPTPSQEMLFGKHRRRVPRWHDPECPVLHGAALGPEAAGQAGAARDLFVDAHLPELLERAEEAFAQHLGRRLAALRTHRVDGARYLVVSLGAAAETAEVVTEQLRGAGVKLGSVGLRVLEPFPAAGLVELLRGKKGVIVAGSTEELSERIRRTLVDLRAKDAPWITRVLYNALNAADLAAAVRASMESDEARPAPIRLGFKTEVPPAYPKLQAQFDALRRAYPAMDDVGVRGGGGTVPLGGSRGGDTADLLPTDALVIAVHRFGAGDTLIRRTAVLLRHLLGGSVRTRPALAHEPWGKDKVDVLVYANEPFRLTNDAVPADVTVHPESGLLRHKDVVYEAGGGDEDHLLGALVGLLGLEGLADVTLRKLLKARREMLAADDIEERLDSLQKGFEKVRRLDAATSDTPGAVAASNHGGPPPTVRRLGRTGSSPLIPPKGTVPFADLPAFWNRAGVLYRDDSGSALLPDPFLATRTVPSLSSALRDMTSFRTELPVFDPAPCTGCGACWAACPDNAVIPAVMAPSVLLEHGMKLAKKNGANVDALRMVLSKLAARVERDALDGGPAGPLFEAAFEGILGKMKLPDAKKDGLREAWEAVRAEIADTPIARTDVFFDGTSPELLSLAIDPNACKGCGLCVTACEPGALEMKVEASLDAGAVRSRWIFCDELPGPSGAAVERARRHPEADPLAGVLLSRAARDVMAGGHGAEPGSDEALALRRALGQAAFDLHEIDAARLDRVREWKTKLGEAIHDGLAHALPDRDLDALAQGLDALHQGEAELRLLTSRVETAFEDDRVDVGRTRRLVDVARRLADLEWRLTTGEGGLGRAPFSLVIAGSGMSWAASFPHNPFRVPVTRAPAGAAVELVRGLVAGQQLEALEAVRVLRRARLELERGSEATRLSEELERLAWDDLDDEERSWCAPVLVAATAEDGRRERLHELPADDAFPVRVVVVDGAPVEQAADREPATDVGQVVPAVVGQVVPAVVGQAVPAVVGQAAPAETVDGDAIAALKRQHEAEMATLRQQYEIRLATERSHFQAEMAQRIRGRLMQFAMGTLLKKDEAVDRSSLEEQA